MTQKANLILNPAKDFPLLQLIRDATFISRQQLELLIAGQTKEMNYDSRNRRLARLVELGQIKVYPPYFSVSRPSFWNYRTGNEDIRTGRTRAV